MDNLLFVNACPRGEGESRTLRLARHFLDQAAQKQPDRAVTELRLTELSLACYHGAALKEREALMKARDFSNPMFDLAKQFAAAERIVVAAPCWDLTFPALLKVYLEHVCVPGITFGYTQKGPAGLCKAKKLLLITTKGGYFVPAAELTRDLAAVNFAALCGMWGIGTFQSLTAEGLDIAGNDPEQILGQAFTEAGRLAETF
ncbi:MAG TPA: NAD(P)H-dependent oxidoreductase [Candidatus Fimivivens faecavium]|nr:NAD(P)H-dependent oxidoreductase [Candidatus Fimivivens faecavium]